MPYDPERHQRQSVRWREHDYAAGGTYFVTLVTQHRLCLLGDVRDGAMCLNEPGMIADREWARSGVIRPEVSVDVFAVMPNHLHGLVTINPPTDGIVGAHGGAPFLAKTTVRSNPSPFATPGRAHHRAPLQRSARSVGSMIAAFKQVSTVAINTARGLPGSKVWQRNFHEHVIRDERSFDAIAAYIVTNAERWETDEHNPDVLGQEVRPGAVDGWRFNGK